MTWVTNIYTYAAVSAAFSYVAFAPGDIRVAFLRQGCSRVTVALPAVFDSGSGYLSTVM
jgi:hypothetical protein